MYINNIIELASLWPDYKPVDNRRFMLTSGLFNDTMHCYNYMLEIQCNVIADYLNTYL